MKRITPLAAWSLLALALVGCFPGAPPPIFQKGFTLGGWTRDDYRGPQVAGQLRALRSIGVEWVALTPHWFQDEVQSTALAADPERSPSDASLVEVIRAVHALGMRVLLKPHVSVRGRGWRGQIRFATEEQWAAWFQAYTGFAAHYARLAEENRVELFCVGVELDGTRHRERDWRALVAAVRAHYAGPLTYAANWDRERDITWWDALDYAGVDAYFPLSPRDDASVEELVAAWQPRVAELGRWARRIRRPVLFTEIGYRSARGAAERPWAWQHPGIPAPEEQARLYRAAFEAVWSQPWFAGFYWWQWRVAPPADALHDAEYTPQGKPALAVVEEYYLRAPRGAAPPGD